MLKKSVAPPTLRDVKIKTGVAFRISKELLAYQKEEKKQQGRIEKLENDGADIHDVKKQQEVLAETTDIIPDCRERLGTALKSLQDLLENFHEDQSEEVIATRKLLEELKLHIE
jgi:tubulin-specific chaperone A